MRGKPIFENLKKEALVCARCGYCRVDCPVYEGLGWESASPRAKMEITRKLAFHGKLTEKDIARLFQCTLCGQCRETCSARIDTVSVWLEMRRRIAAGEKGPENMRRLAAAIDETGYTAGEAPENRRLWLEAMDDEAVLKRVGQKAELLYFTGCSGALYPQIYGIPQAFTRILTRSGADFTVLGENESCCGFPLAAAGEPERIRKQAEHNVAAAKELGVRTVVTTCPSCFHAWRDFYPEILGGETPFEVLHASQWLAREIAADRLRLGPVEERVTYHDPCDLGRNSGVFEEPRHVLNQIPGLELVEMECSGSDAACCGGGGNLEAVDPALTEVIAEARLREAEATAAKTVVSGCQQCKRTLQGNARRKKIRLRFADITELVDRSMAAYEANQ